MLSCANGTGSSAFTPKGNGSQPSIWPISGQVYRRWRSFKNDWKQPTWTDCVTKTWLWQKLLKLGPEPAGQYYNLPWLQSAGPGKGQHIQCGPITSQSSWMVVGFGFHGKKLTVFKFQPIHYIQCSKKNSSPVSRQEVFLALYINVLEIFRFRSLKM